MEIRDTTYRETHPRPTLRAVEHTFDDWYARYYQRLVRASRKIVGDQAAAEDVAQETLLRAWQAQDRLAERADVYPWLATVAHNLAVDIVRSRTRQIPTDELPEAADESADPSLRAEVETRRATIRQAMQSVSERHRTLLYLKDVEELDYQELSGRTGLSPGAARAVVLRARRSFRTALERAAGAAGGGALVFLPGRVFAGLRRVLAEAAPRMTSRSGLAAELAVGAMAVLSSVSVPAQGPSASPGASIQPDVAAAPAADVRPAPLTPGVPGLTGLPGETPSAPAEVEAAATEASQAAGQAAEVPDEAWEARVMLAERKGEPGTGIGVGVEISTEDDRAIPRFLGRTLSRVPEPNVSLLKRKSKAGSDE